jgi:hypothetical protein
MRQHCADKPDRHFTPRWGVRVSASGRDDQDFFRLLTLDRLAKKITRFIILRKPRK